MLTINRMSCFNALVVILWLFEKTVVSARHGVRSRKTISDSVDGSSITCIMVEVEYIILNTEGMNNKPSSWRCIPVDVNSYEHLEAFETSYIIQDNVIASEEFDLEVVSGETILSISNSTLYVEDSGLPSLSLSSDSIVLPTGNTQNDQGQRRRALSPTVGESSVLILRVTDAAQHKPTKSASEISDDFFGNGNDRHNLKSIYSKCSGGQLEFLKARGENVDNGVAEVSLPIDVSGLSVFVVENWVDNIAPTVVGSLAQWTHVVYVLPEEVDFEGVAGYAYVGWWKSVLWNMYASHVIVQVHEMGHNLGMYHSGENRYEYGDGTCMMGAHIYEDEAPRMCFNAAKSWWLGWYDDRTLELDGSNVSWQGYLAGVHDYVKGRVCETQYVLIKIKSPEAKDDLYIMYNRKKGVNNQVTQDENAVTVVKAPTSFDQSWLVAGLRENKKAIYRKSNFAGLGHDLVIEVCERINDGSPDRARVLIYLSGADRDLSCY